MEVHPVGTSHTGNDLYHDALKALQGGKGADVDMTEAPAAHALSDQPSTPGVAINHIANDSEKEEDTSTQKGRGSMADDVMNDNVSSDESFRMSQSHKHENGDVTSHSGRTRNSDSSGSATPRATLAQDLEVDDNESDSESVHSSSRIDVERYYQKIAVDESEDASLYTYVPRRLPRRREGETDTITSTQTMYEGDVEYQMENGRRYSPSSFMPNDEEEQSRQEIIHQVFLFLFNSELTTVALPKDTPLKILDIGTGTGSWAIGIAEQYPDADVTGIDLSPIQPGGVPSNVFFEIFDVEDPIGWTWPYDNFDLIHLRNMTGSFVSWPLVYGRSFAALKPGGAIEVLDVDDQAAYRAKIRPDSAFHTWFATLASATTKSGKVFNADHLNLELLREAGFVDVKEENHKVPMGKWPVNDGGQTTAKMWLVGMIAGLEALSLRPFTQQLGWDQREVRELCDDVQQEFREGAALNVKAGIEFSVSVKVVTGRKPEW